jgi:hypothetical protein
MYISSLQSSKSQPLLRIDIGCDAGSVDKDSLPTRYFQTAVVTLPIAVVFPFVVFELEGAVVVATTPVWLLGTPVLITTISVALMASVLVSLVATLLAPVVPDVL